MKYPKGLILIQGKAWILSQLDRFREAGGRDAIVVLGHHRREYEACLSNYTGLDLRLVINPLADQGQFSSIQVGIKALSDAARGVFVSPVDVPLPGKDVWLRLAGALRGPTLVCQAVFSEKGGHPVLLARSFANRLLSIAPSEVSARLDFQIHALTESEVRRLCVSEAAILSNLNNPEDLARFSPPSEQTLRSEA